MFFKRIFQHLIKGCGFGQRQKGKNLFCELPSLSNCQRFNKFFQRVVKENAEICSAFQPDKAVLLNLPRIDIVLEKTFLIALYNCIALLMLKHHAENA